ncbi:MAG: hypothetical protein KDA57_20405, partial [Planctomycetales bacterium]|nr:hypothetical protein [Planctomycetales bacterium]
MRSHPFCWNKTLTQLGFKRKRRKHSRRRDYLSRRSLFEMLEERQMLSGDPLLEVTTETTVVVAGSEQLATLGFSQPEYFLTHDNGSGVSDSQQADVPTLLVVETRYEEGTPRAILSINPELADSPPTSVQTMLLELRQDGRVIESYQIVVDIAEQSFREQFLADRVSLLAQEIDPVDQTLEEDWFAEKRLAKGDDSQAISWEFFNVAEGDSQGDYLAAASPHGTQSVDLLVSLATRQSERRDLLVDGFDRSYFYRQAEQSAQQLKLDRQAATTDVERAAVAEREQTLSKMALLLGRELEQDLKSESAEIAQAARKLRDELVAISDPMEILFAGLGVDREVSRKFLSSGDEKALSFIETGQYQFNDVLAFELGEYQAMVQVTRRSSLQFASAMSIAGSPAVLDGTFSEATPAVPDGSSASLYVNSATGAQQEALIRFDLEQVAGLENATPIATAALELQELAGSSGTAEVYVWKGLLADSATDWDEDNLSWNRVYETLDLDSKLDEFKPLSDWQSGVTTSVDVADVVQRALLYGDANGDGEFFGGGAAGDIEAFHLAVTNWNAYEEEYGPRANSLADLIARNDGGLGDGVIDTADIADFFKRLGYSQGDYNLDGTVQDEDDWGVDGLDWAVYQANLGMKNARFGQGDGNFDGKVDSSDFEVWSNRINNPLEDNVSAEIPELVFWLRPTANSSLEFASKDSAADGPKLVIAQQPDLVVNKFGVANGNLVVDYSVLGQAFDDIAVQVFKVGDPNAVYATTGIHREVDSYQEVIPASALAAAEGDSFFAKVIGTPVAGIQSNLANDTLDFEFSTQSVQAVNSLDDAGMDTLLRDKHTLRELLEANNVLGWYDTLDFSNASLFVSGPGTVALGDHDQDNVADPIEISADISIVGPGVDVLSLSGGGQTHLFKVEAGASVDVSDLTITQGYNLQSGGAIHNLGDLAIDNVRLTDSVAITYGGAIFTDRGGSLAVARTTLDDNQARYGGGIAALMDTDDTLSIGESTFSNNTATNSSGGLHIIGVTGAEPDVSIDNSTFSGNSAVDKYGGAISHYDANLRIHNSTIFGNTAELSGGGLRVGTGTTTILHNTILAGNTVLEGSATTSDASGNIGGTATEQSSSNIVGVGYSGHAMNSSINMIGDTTDPEDPGLAPLGDYGGPTKTHALLATSIAREYANSTYAISLDQRGFAVSGSSRDTGAFEYYETTEVNTLADSNLAPGDLSLRQAINLASLESNPTITFASELEGTILLQAGVLTIDSQMT